MTRRARRRSRAAACAAGALVSSVSLADPRIAAAQGARVVGVTTARLVELRQLATDSIRAADVADTVGSLYRSADGIVADCIPGQPFCYYKRSADRVESVPLTQDILVNAWGFGTGVRAVADVRLRAALGTKELWPRADDTFDALAAYVEIDRGQWRARGGRQWLGNNLGAYNFDGADVLYRWRPGWSVDAWGGWSLVRGLNEPHTSDEFAGVEDIPPEHRAYIIGASGRIPTSKRGGLSLLYQREIRTDLGGLYSERAAADWSARFSRASVDASWQHDLAYNRVNEARLRVQAPFRAPAFLGRGAAFDVAAEYRHFVPFFEYWTIWGAFSPVGFDEARATGVWSSPRRDVTVSAFGAWRDYGDTDAGTDFDPLKGSGWRAGADATWRMSPAWTATGGWASDIGFGASRTDVDGAVRWARDNGAHLGAFATGFQQVRELRLGTGRVIGAGLDGGVRLTPDVRVLGDVAIYQHRDRDGGSPSPDWSQRRATLRLEWTMGSDPGMARARAGDGR